MNLREDHAHRRGGLRDGLRDELVGGAEVLLLPTTRPELERTVVPLREWVEAPVTRPLASRYCVP